MEHVLKRKSTRCLPRARPGASPGLPTASAVPGSPGAPAESGGAHCRQGAGGEPSADCRKTFEKMGQTLDHYKTIIYTSIRTFVD